MGEAIEIAPLPELPMCINQSEFEPLAAWMLDSFSRMKFVTTSNSGRFQVEKKGLRSIGVPTATLGRSNAGYTMQAGPSSMDLNDLSIFLGLFPSCSEPDQGNISDHHGSVS